MNTNNIFKFMNGCRDLGIEQVNIQSSNINDPSLSYRNGTSSEIEITPNDKCNAVKKLIISLIEESLNVTLKYGKMFSSSDIYLGGRIEEIKSEDEPYIHIFIKNKKIIAHGISLPRGKTHLTIQRGGL